MTLVSRAREEAERLLLSNGGPLGLLAAARSYRQVWARDAMVGGFGLMLAQAPEARVMHRRSMETLRAHQSALGNIPNNVGLPGPDPAFVAEGRAYLGRPGEAPRPAADTARAGCIDNSLWYLIGRYLDHALDPDDGRLQQAWPSMERAHLWLQYQDANECGLLEAHEAMDWADLFANRYNTLMANVLWYGANRALGFLATSLGRAAEAERFRARAADIRFKLNTLLWVGPERPRDRAWIAEHRKEWLFPTKVADAILQERPFFLPYVAERDVGDRFDTFGNLLAILFGAADARQTARILGHIRATGLDDPWPIRACDPPVHPGEKEWREYYRGRGLNLPDQYHNGGAWPFLGGFYVAALVKARRLDEARRQLDRLAEMNRLSRDGAEWEFNEWFHGRSGRPMGFPGQSWSAAMYLYAHGCVERERCPGFEEESGW